MTMVNELATKQSKKKRKLPKAEKPAASNFRAEVYPPCHIAYKVYFTPDCPISGHKSCQDCLEDETFWMLELLRDLHKYGFGMS